MRRLIHRSLAAASAVTTAALMALMLPGGLAQAATSVGQATVELSSHSAQATDVTYTVGFIATSGLAVGGTVTLTGPAGLTSVAAPMLTRSSSAGGATGTWTVGFTATQGWYESQVKLTAPAGTTFPASTGDYTVYNDTSGNSYGFSLVGTPGTP